MSEEEIQEKLRRLDEHKKQREKEYIKAKAILEGIQLTKLNPQQEAYLKLLAYMLDQFRVNEEHIISLNEGHLTMVARVDKLEKEINQLRTTMNKLYESK